MTNGLSEVDVEFQILEEAFVEPPDPDYLRAHSTLSMYSAASQTCKTLAKAAKDAEMRGTLHLKA